MFGSASSFLLTIIVLVVLGILFMAFAPLAKRAFRRPLPASSLGLADVVSASQTGTILHGQPEVRLVLRIASPAGPPHEVEVRQAFAPTSIPKAGDQVPIRPDPTNPARVVLASAE